MGKSPGRLPDRAIQMRVPDELLSAVDKWRSDQVPGLSRADAIRRLLGIGLTAAPQRSGAHFGALEAKEMAGEEVDRLSDRSASHEEQQARKRRLVKGPSEFREMRRDQPKKAAP